MVMTMRTPRTQAGGSPSVSEAPLIANAGGVASNLLVVGNPENRRVSMFVDAATQGGVSTTVLPWAEVLTGVENGDPVAIPDGQQIRLDSPGENPDVEARLRRLGGWDRPLAHGEIGGWQEWALGLTIAATHLCAAGSADTSVADLTSLFDKRSTRERLAAADVPIASPGPTVAEVPACPGRWFVKTAHGSSGSGVLAVTVGRDRLSARGPVELVDGVPYNDFTLREHTGRAAEAVLNALAARGPLQVERWFPKASLNGLTVDLRVVVVAGRARNVVARGSRGPLTNLHLGNQRVDVDLVRARAGDRLWTSVMDVAERAAAEFPDTRCVGVDVMINSIWSRCAVAEVNAFGDLLPRALHEGRSTYDWQVADHLNRTALAA